MRKGEKISYEYTLEKASELKNSQAVRELHSLVYDPASLHDLTIQRKWLAQFGGSYVGIKMVNLILPNILFATEYTILDWFTHLKAARISLEKMWKPLLTIDFSETITKLDVPVYFFVGIQDFLTPAELTEEYYSFLKCPYKELIWFENSAHMLCFEEPDKFYQECVRIKEKSPLSWDVEYDEINS
jgi:pimeloyl-ACP methyl ester carboxylesterase